MISMAVTWWNQNDQNGSTLRLGFKLWTCEKTWWFHGDFRSFSLMFLSGLLRTFTCLLCSMFFYCLAAAMFSWKQILFYWFSDMTAYHPNGFGFAWHLGRRRLCRAHWLCQTLLERENSWGFPKGHIHSASFSFPFQFVAYHVLLHFKEITETVSKARASSLFLPALRVVVEFQHGKSGRRSWIRIFPSMASCKRPTRCIGINPAGTSVTSVSVKLASCP